MEKAKQAVQNFISHDGKHKTTVEQDVRGHITEEHVKPHRHENVTTAVDREVHQDHHQTVIQPIQHKETLPEKHTHNVMPVEHKEFHHGDQSEHRDTLNREAARFKDSSVTHETTHSAAEAPVVSGERTHHHVHHHVQPVIQKETVQPHVVHTTMPVHETHHAAPIHHETTVLPTKTMDEYTTSGHAKLGETRGPKQISEFEGCPTLKDENLRSDPQAHQAIHGHSH